MRASQNEATPINLKERSAVFLEQFHKKPAFLAGFPHPLQTARPLRYSYRYPDHPFVLGGFLDD